MFTDFDNIASRTKFARGIPRKAARKRARRFSHPLVYPLWRREKRIGIVLSESGHASNFSRREDCRSLDVKDISHFPRGLCYCGGGSETTIDTRAFSITGPSG